MDEIEAEVAEWSAWLQTRNSWLEAQAIKDTSGKAALDSPSLQKVGSLSWCRRRKKNDAKGVVCFETGGWGF